MDGEIKVHEEVFEFEFSTIGMRAGTNTLVWNCPFISIIDSVRILHLDKITHNLKQVMI